VETEADAGVVKMSGAGDSVSRNSALSGLKELNSCYANNLFGWAKTAAVGLVRDDVHLQIVPAPSTGNGWFAARTKQGPFFWEARRERKKIRAISIGTEADQITSPALRTLDAMAKTWRHGKNRLTTPSQREIKAESSPPFLVFLVQTHE